ncbi:MAG TPA: carboxyl transferase domain-containing protein [Caulobacteraceae bacterium]|jgi:acetyl/propionyl-CoA carboxylase alpha subunit/acetyl-CoA carboxylase carboxyltransferase component
MGFKTVLIANRGEIAVRIARAVAGLGLKSVAVFSEDDARSLHIRAADQAMALKGVGARAYLDAEVMIAAALEAGCDAVHPGYGFLSENQAFARACAARGLTFIGPRAEALALFGDKARARALALESGVAIARGTQAATSLEQARAFFDALGSSGAMMIKALAGGGGRGMRMVGAASEIEEAFTRCASEAKAAFGDGALYVEELIAVARHIEVQVLGDQHGGLIHLWDRDCSLQRRHQKLIEIAPSPHLSEALRARLTEAALTLAQAADYDSLGTFEFLVDADADDERFVFMEANPRLQVEHTVTEEVTGVDLVRAQIEVAQGRSLAELGLSAPPTLIGYAVQLRVNTETMDAIGAVKPTGGVIGLFEPPSGPGVRVDTYGYAGYATNPNFDSLLAKVIVHDRSSDFAAALAKAGRALDEFRLTGVETNLPILRALVARPQVREGRIFTRLVEREIAGLLEEGDVVSTRFFEPDTASAATGHAAEAAPVGTEPLGAPTQGLLVSISVAQGDLVRPGQAVAVLESMKMEHLVEAVAGGRVRAVAARIGETLFEGQPILFIEPAEVDHHAGETEEAVDLDAIRPDLAELNQRRDFGLDAHRPEAVAKRHKLHMRTARENVDAIVDAGSFIEYGALAIAAQRRRRSTDDLMRNTPADGLITGIGSVNGDLFGEERSRCAVLAYDYTVLAGTQGTANHKKTDRILQVAERERLPVIWFAEGGGGRPGDTDGLGATGLDVPTFELYARMSGLAPRIGIAAGRCFAGNAVFWGCSDITIATKNSTIGMSGPAMIEGGGLGVFTPEQVGPIAVQDTNGVVDLVAEDELEAADLARRLMAYFQGPIADWTCADQRRLRRAIPENRLRVYDVRALIRLLVDEASFLEIRSGFGKGMITGFARIEGRPVGLIANDPRLLGGAIDADGATKAARFMQLCDAFDLPLLSLCDTPGFMVGPDAEKTAPVRHGSRMFVTAGAMQVPIFSIVLRKGYGLGAQAMTGGTFPASFFTIAWPTGEFGGMGLEGAVRLGYRKELEAETDPAAKKALFDQLVARSYERGKAVNVAQVLEIDAVIDPVDSRAWIARGLKSRAPRVETERRRFIDTW